MKEKIKAIAARVKTPDKKKVADLMIKDVLEMPLFRNNLKNVLDRLAERRRYARYCLAGPLKSHPIDKLFDNGDWEPHRMARLYYLIICKALNGYSSRERAFISQTCFEAYGKTIKTLIKQEKGNETKGDNGDRDDQ